MFSRIKKAVGQAAQAAASAADSVCSDNSDAAVGSRPLYQSNTPHHIHSHTLAHLVGTHTPPYLPLVRHRHMLRCVACTACFVRCGMRVTWYVCVCVRCRAGGSDVYCGELHGRGREAAGTRGLRERVPCSGHDPRQELCIEEGACCVRCVACVCVCVC